jgi:hypothetical protein
MRKLLAKIEFWIDVNLVYFLYNGRKQDRYFEMLQRKWNLKK